MKTCARCHISKPEDEFYASPRWTDGRHPYCKPCLLAYQRESRRRRLDEKTPNRRRWSANFVRHDYFSAVENPMQGYVAGLLAADGNVLERQRRVSLELSSRDEALVLLTRDEIAPEFPVRGRTRPNGVKTTLLAVTSTQLCADLAKLHITPRKSRTFRWPEQIANSVCRFFLLGYFDGDGFAMRGRNGRHTYLRWGLLGTREFLFDAMNFISSETGIRPRHVRRDGTKHVCRLHINGADAAFVDGWLHAGTELGLARKRF